MKSSAAFILIPGAGGDPWHWHLVEPRLRLHGHEAVAVALPAADDAAGLPDYADAVDRAIGHPDALAARLVAYAAEVGLAGNRR